jgi:TonB-dependent siderophore receptor
MGVFARMSAGGRRNLFYGLLMAGTALAACGGALAQEIWTAQAAPARQRAFDIAPQPLTDALALFGRQSGMQVSADAGLVRGLSSPGVTGTMAPEQALARLLSGTGLTWRLNGDTAMLEKAAADGAMTLDPVTVEGAALQAEESAYAPVRGYVAKRSATATKTDSSILETPQSISVVGAEELEARDVRTLEDAIKYSPGVRLTYGAAGDTRNAWYGLRGFSTSAYYQDGLRLNGLNWSRLDSSLLERVEILRGPASVMYGQAVPGGIVNMVTKRPREEQAAEIAVEYGSFDWKRAEGGITGSLDEKRQWLYRVTAALQDSDGPHDMDHDKNDRKLFAPSLTWQPKEGSAVTMAVVRQDDDSRGAWLRTRFRTAAGETDPSTYRGEPDYDEFHQEQTHLMVLADHEVNDRLKVSLSARYSHYDLDYRQMWDGSVQPGGVLFSRGNYYYYADADSYAIDARVQKKLSLLSTEHTLTGGMDYAYLDKGVKSSYVGDAAINLFNPVYGNYTRLSSGDLSTENTRQLGFYAQDQIQVGENWFFLLSGRQDMKGSAHQDAFTGRLGVAYKTGFGLVPYASYAESFEPQSGTGWGGAKFEPTTGRQYEVGVKYEPPGVNAMATVALFDLAKQNVLTTDPDPTHLCDGWRCQVQTGEVTSRGIELGLTMGLAEGLNAVAAYTYNPISVTKSNDPAEVGRQQADQPIHTASLWLDYGVQDGPLAGFGMGGGLRFIGRTTNSAGNLSTSPQLLDEAMVRYDLQGWRLSLNVKNLLDRDVEYGCTRQTDAEICYLNEPLTLTARVARKF